LESNKDWNLSERRKSLSQDKRYINAFTPLLYRPFDTVAYFHHDDVVDRTRNDVMRHLLNRDNIALCIGRQFSVIGTDIYDIVAVTDWPLPDLVDTPKSFS